MRESAAAVRLSAFRKPKLQGILGFAEAGSLKPPLILALFHRKRLESALAVAKM